MQKLYEAASTWSPGIDYFHVSVSFIFVGSFFIRKNSVINLFCFQRTEIEELCEELRDEKIRHMNFAKHFSWQVNYVSNTAWIYIVESGTPFIHSI